MPLQMAMTSQTTRGGLQLEVEIYYGLEMGDPGNEEARFKLKVSWGGDYQVARFSDGGAREDASIVWSGQTLARGNTASYDVEFDGALSEPVTATLTPVK